MSTVGKFLGLGLLVGLVIGAGITAYAYTFAQALHP